MAATTAPASPVHVDVDLYPDIQRFGAADISACFSCGTCSATCPMSQVDGTFPRESNYIEVDCQERDGKQEKRAPEISSEDAISHNANYLKRM